MISERDVLKMIDAAPSAEWCCFLAMSFYGGLRTPSEHKALTWSRIRLGDGAGMMTVISPKTERQGKASREVPIFTELRPYLEDLLEVQGYPVATDPVFPGLGQKSDANLRKQAYAIRDKAGVDPIPKMYQNMRSTRQTTLEAKFPRGTDCQWMGNTEAVAEQHYVQEMESFRLTAASERTMGGKTPQILTQQSAVNEVNGRQSASPNCTPANENTEKSAKSLIARKAEAEVDGNRTHQARVNAPQRF